MAWGTHLWSVKWQGIAMLGESPLLILGDERPESIISKARRVLAEIEKKEHRKIQPRIVQIEFTGIIDAF